ncbi:hypothetical protein PVAG01_02987 [Phlyctema vagabunda]|uniref:Uncharacterized protein n=1 Tax=Phlyctema vagabunda TaxID=108571 RepID=A0ABR4PS71_9HELO
MHLTSTIITTVALSASALAGSYGAPSAGPSTQSPHVADLWRRLPHGWCGVHVTATRNTTDNKRYADIRVYDFEQYLAWEGTSLSSNGSPIKANATGVNLPQALNITVGLTNDNVATFEFGDEYWGSGNPSTHNYFCSVGPWYLPGVVLSKETVDLCCRFWC